MHKLEDIGAYPYLRIGSGAPSRSNPLHQGVQGPLVPRYDPGRSGSQALFSGLILLRRRLGSITQSCGPQTIANLFAGAAFWRRPHVKSWFWAMTKRSGKHRECHQRWACNKHLRYAVHLFSEHTITRCAWAEIYYKAHRAKDHSHATALRCLGQLWLKIIHKMWMDRTPYNAELHHLNQVKHGSWVFQLQTVNRK
jgi:hypothetical protein